ncbi:MAG: hypothetical protein ACOX4U_04125 [Anaerovoracaceae bacterium]|jgi:ethanolamine utilization cobalamin adenosyltransferase
MRFITEDDLRESYGKQPFISYEIIPGTRLTPGARQFLADRQIFPSEVIISDIKADEIAEDPAVDRMECRIRSMEALFLAVAEELLSVHARRAVELMDLGESLRQVELMLKGEKAEEGIGSQQCAGMDQVDLQEYQDDCFRINGHHIQLAEGKEIIAMHRLRCQLRELRLDMRELFSKDQVKNHYMEAERRINQIINTLSQMICDAVGGKTCQKKT